MNTKPTPVTMKEEQIKQIKKNFTDKLNTLVGYSAQLAFIVGARLLNSEEYEQGIKTAENYLAIDAFLNIHFKSITETAKP